MKKILSLEAILIVFCVMGAAATGWYLLSSHPAIRSQPNEVENIGYVRPEGNDVRIRGEKEVTWNRVGRDSNVFKNDKVFTGSSSSAQVKLKSKDSFKVEPNSLIVISDEGDSTFGVESGSFLAELKKGAKFFVQSHNHKTEVASDGATIRLESREGKKLKLVVLKGEAAVKTSEAPAPQTVKANEEAVIEAAAIEIKPLQIALQTPDPGAILWNREKPIDFKWTYINDDEKARKASRMHVEISKDPLFKTGSILTDVEGETFSKELAAGVYFWRVLADGKRSSSSPTSSFTLYDLKAPLVHNEVHIKVEMNWKGEVQSPVAFAWNDPSLSDSYEFQIASASDFSKVDYSETTSKNEVNITGLKKRTYFWRVISKHPSREDLTSDVALIEIQNRNEELPPAPAPPPVIEEKPIEVPVVKIELPKKPEPIHVTLVSPEKDETFSVKHDESLETTFSWKIDGDYDEANLIIEKGRIFRKVVKKAVVTNANEYVVRFKSEGRFTWSIEAKNSKTGQTVTAASSFKIEREDPPKIVPMAKIPEKPKSEPPRKLASVDENSVLKGPLQSRSEPMPPRKRGWLSIGSGYDYISFNQSMGTQPTVDYASTGGPSLAVRGGYESGNYGIEADFNHTPGQIKTAGVSISSTDFVWQSLSLEGTYRLFDHTIFGTNRIMGEVRFGGQYHQLPYVLVKNSELYLDQYSVGAASAGFDVWYKTRNHFRYQLLMRYQQPLFSSDQGDGNFKPTTQFAFDGSIGGDYLFQNNVSLGLFWYGQLQQYKYSLTQGDGTSDGGSQKLFFSNFEVRLGYEF